MRRVVSILVPVVAALLSCDRPSTPAAPAVRNDQVTWYVHRATPLLSLRQESTFVSFSFPGNVPSRAALVKSLDRDDAFVAAHLLLANGPALAGEPGTFDADSAHRTMAIDLEAKGRVALEDRADGSCLATIDGLRVVLRPGAKKGSYFGQGRTNHTIYVTTAEVEPGQRAAIRDRWRRRN